MSVTISASPEKQTVNVTINGRFDFSQHEEFGKVLDYTKDRNFNRYIIDLGGVEEIDSSAIGMILLLKDMAGGDSCKIELTRIRASIKEELQIANIDRLVKVA